MQFLIVFVFRSDSSDSEECLTIVTGFTNPRRMNFQTPFKGQSRCWPSSLKDPLLHVGCPALFPVLREKEATELSAIEFRFFVLYSKERTQLYY